MADGSQPLAVIVDPDLAQRLDGRYYAFGEHWLWCTLRLDHYGYGRIKISGRDLKAHRVVYQFETGIAVPEYMSMDHLCGIKSCVRPTHLEIVTRGENVKRAWVRGETANALSDCDHGDWYSRPSGNGGYCRTCRRENRKGG